MGRERQCKIENPLMGGNPTTSMERARRFVRKGVAEFTGEFTIRFFDNAARRRIELDAEKRFHARLTGVGYDVVEENAWTAKYGEKGGNKLEWSFHVSVFGHRAGRTEGA